MPKVKKQRKKTQKRRPSGQPTFFSRLRNHTAARFRGARYRAGAAARLAATGITAVATIGLVGLWGGGLLGGVMTGMGHSADRALAAAGFNARMIDVAGADKTGAVEVREALGDLSKESIFALDIDAAQAQVESLAWVEKATVSRLLPNRLAVVIHERRPMALWQNEGQFAVLDSSGGVISGADAAQYTDLPVVVGDGAAGMSPELVRALRQFPQIVARVEAVQRVGERRWTLWMNSGMKVHLPEGEGPAALAILNNLQTERHILDAPAMLIDLRDEKRIVIRPEQSLTPDEVGGREA